MPIATCENYKKHSYNKFLVDLMAIVLLRRNLADLLHSTGAKKPNETNKTVVLLQTCIKKITKLHANCCVKLYFPALK